MNIQTGWESGEAGMIKSKNKCQKCGGRLVAEYIGSYGDVFLLNSKGEPCKSRLKRHIYEHDGELPMIYCNDCRSGYEKCGYEAEWHE